MIRHVRAVFVAALAVTLIGDVRAQEQPAAPPAAQSAPLVPLQMQIVVSRYQGDKRVSTLPYTISANANAGNYSRLRMGARVPVPNEAFGPTGNRPFNYQDIGTNIDCLAKTADNGRFQIELTIEDTSVYADAKAAPETPRIGDLPVFRSFRSTNTLMLRDGQTSQFTAATDRISGEIIKVDVTLVVVK